MHVNATCRKPIIARKVLTDKVFILLPDNLPSVKCVFKSCIFFSDTDIR